MCRTNIRVGNGQHRVPAWGDPESAAADPREYRRVERLVVLQRQPCGVARDAVHPRTVLYS